MDATVSPLWDDAHHHIVGFAAIQRDVTAQQQSEDDLRHKTALLATEHDASLDGILVVDEHGRVVLFNRQFLSVWGLEREVLASGEDAPILTAATSKVADRESFLSKVRSLYEHRDQTSRDEVELRDGRVLDRYSAPMRSAEGEYFGRVWFFRDISDRKRIETELRQSEAHLKREAHYDRLTGLPNRRLLMERLNDALAATRQGSGPAFDLLFIDLDNFKHVNDSLGHDVGDQLLLAFARRLSVAVRKEDTLARLGGDEFVLLTIGGCDGELTLLADRIHRALQTPFLLAGRSITVTASVGVATSRTMGAGDAGDLLRDADTAMYQAKRTGKARSAIFTHEMHEAAVRRFDLENDLRRAVERKEFVLHYQPIAETSSRPGVRLEALLRWQHPTRGLLLPGAFIHLAEELGLMDSIGEWVLRTACADGHRLRRATGRPLRVAVNISPKQLASPDLAATVARVVEDTGFAPHHLELELSENSIFDASSTVAETLQRLARSGVRLSIDDFGLVHASIRHLARLPIATIKVDQSIVRDIFKDQAGPVIMQALIALGHGLNLEVIAEGVETHAQATFLREHGCDALQGWLFAPAMPLADLERRLLASPASSDSLAAEMRHT
jgi:diguanylate cyclase (GGDEF)-like protein/PAS domain S-box-containing protein